MRSARVRRGGVFGLAAFTLVELLVVIGIIAVLIGILLPTLARAREQSKRAVCAANLRTLGQGMLMYANAHRDRLPNGNPPGTVEDWTSSQVLIVLNRDYVRGPGSFHCPSDDSPVPTAIDNADHNAANSARVSYDFYSITWLPEKGPKLPAMNRVSTKRDQAPLAWDMNVNPEATVAPDQNHGPKGGNVLFADGHVEWQEARLWDRGNWPHPADAYYPQ